MNALRMFAALFATVAIAAPIPDFSLAGESAGSTPGGDGAHGAIDRECQSDPNCHGWKQ